MENFDREKLRVSTGGAKPFAPAIDAARTNWKGCHFRPQRAEKPHVQGIRAGSDRYIVVEVEGKSEAFHREAAVPPKQQLQSRRF